MPGPGGDNTHRCIPHLNNCIQGKLWLILSKSLGMFFATMNLPT
jgi:hypothetical protein